MNLHDVEFLFLIVKTKEEAEKYAATDPAVAAGLFAVDLVPWYSEPSESFIHGKPEKKD